MTIISTGALAERLGTPGTCIFDVRADLADPTEGRRRYGAGHLPDAVFVDLESDLTGAAGPGRHPLPRPEVFSATVRRLGVSDGDLVVAYDDMGGVWASRLWWMLRSLGHESVAVLDGGIAAWSAEGRPTTLSEPRIKPGSFRTRREWSGVVDRTAIATTDSTVVDARAPERYRGEVEPIDPIPGHIPGAINIPFAGNLDEEGRFLPPSELAERFEGIGETPIVYCGSGVSACHDLLAMEHAGLGGALLYEGSWSDWSRQPEPAVETGG